MFCIILLLIAKFSIQFFIYGVCPPLIKGLLTDFLTYLFIIHSCSLSDTSSLHHTETVKYTINTMYRVWQSTPLCYRCTRHLFYGFSLYAHIMAFLLRNDTQKVLKY